MMAFMLIVFNSCKRETVDVTQLLTSVPSSASGVVVFNVEGMLEDAGCKIKDHVVKPGAEVQALISKASSQDQKDIMMFFDGSTGIEPKGAVIFYDSNRSFLTFALYDVSKFIEFVEKNNGGKFTETSGVKINGNVALVGSQAWVCLTPGKRLDPDAIASYASLGSAQSFLVSPMGEMLLVDENDIRGWAVIKTFMNELMSRGDLGYATLGMGFLFEDAESVRFKVDFDKGEMESEIVVLNDKFKPAKYQLSSDKVDVNTLKSLGNTCNAMMAFTINSKLIKKLNQAASAFGSWIKIGELLNNVDGTVGLVSTGDGIGESVNGVVTTKGDVSKELKDMISTWVSPVSQDGKLLRFSKGDVKGNLDVAECADELKGCAMGLIVDASELNNLGYGISAPAGFKTFVLKMKPESGGIELELELNTTNPKENALLTILKSMN